MKSNGIKEILPENSEFRRTKVDYDRKVMKLACSINSIYVIYVQHLIYFCFPYVRALDYTTSQDDLNVQKCYSIMQFRLSMHENVWLQNIVNPFCCSVGDRKL